ncbi:argininosuccinate lyase [Cupriavidus gilardii]|uniref:argininosuccinate lyase n=1 Tax=Cupriavidus gilardii TaxID=82541 RepID=UPI0015802F33|nr:argininosuccinate lyase [Cupriavidus gilardii]MCT9071229.1 argininosuccinate lyase [Cupriavidus gilardii]QKS60853.1 argininosuccinate lyase [Cupriavidus gilardii]
MLKTRIGILALAISAHAVPAFAQSAVNRDEFYWLGEINKATTVINTDEGLLDKSLAPRIASGIVKVLDDGNRPGGKRPSTVITFEPLLIQAAGVEVTLLHAGRSSQDMHATYRAAILRDNLLSLADQLNKTSRSLVSLAEKHANTIVPNYTNGVAAQPNSLGHYLLGHAAGLERDAQRIRGAYARIDRSPMGTTVLNGTSWPLNRARMADYLGFSAIVDNAYDAAQISSTEQPVEVGAIVTSIALHAGNFIEDVMTQYAQSRPWMLLQEGGSNTYVSSAMPQKRNPGLLNTTRRHASTAVTLAMGPVIQAHNITPGMGDAKEVKPNSEMVQSAIRVLQGWDKILNALVISPERALEELNSDWTASQELADVLMRKYKLPFRVGHHFASEVVDYAKANNIRPSEFPYAQAQRIYAEAVKGQGPAQLPMSEAEFRAALDPVAIVRHRATVGGPQPAEMERMLKAAKQSLAQQDAWIKEKRGRIDASLARLDRDFGKLVKAAN